MVLQLENFLTDMWVGGCWHDNSNNNNETHYLSYFRLV